MTWLLRLYHALPAPLWPVAAGLRGWWLRRWRYGAETERLAAEALAREAWTPAQWDAWRQPRLSALLERAATRVPYYRDWWLQQGGGPERWRELANWPVLEKETVRGAPEAFLADDCAPRRMFPEHTSGTSGTPVRLWWSRDTVRRWYALFEARWRRWYGVGRDDRWAILGGQLVVPSARRRPPFWVWNAPMRQLYLSSQHLSPATAAAYVGALHRYRVTYLFGYSSALASLAAEITRQGLRPPPLRVVITNAEPLLAWQRAGIQTAFVCPVRETYGMAEIVTAAGECEHGRMHLWPEAGVVEVVTPDGAAAFAGAVGDLVCTGLVNDDMPLIRYRLGDRGRLGPVDGGSCPCGRRLPVLLEVEGRCDDVVVTPSGRRLGRLDPVFKGDMAIREAQIIQEAPERLRVLVVPAAGFGPAAAGEIRERLLARLEPGMAVAVETVAAIPREANGKFRAVVRR